MNCLAEYLSDEEIFCALGAPNDDDSVRGSLLYKMYYELRKEAVAYAKENNLNVEYELENLISRCDNAIQEISSAFLGVDWNNDFESPRNKYDFFDPHVSNIQWVLDEKRKLMEVWRSELESGIEDYLELPVRSDFIDKLLLQMLVAAEIHGYADNISKPRLIPLFGRKRNNIFLKGRAGLLGETVKSLLFSTVIYIIIGIVFGIITMLWRPFAWSFVLLALLVLWDLGVHIFGAVRVLFQDMKQFSKLLYAMGRVESALSTQHGARDTLRHFRKLVEDAENANVVWPNALHPILEDMEQRGVTRI